MNIKKFLFGMSFIMIAVMPVFAFAQTFDRDLYFGLQNDTDVTKLQEFLTDEGLYTGPITGNFFSLTLSGVKAFQSREGITPVAGYFGPKTRTRANQILSSQIQASENQAVIETGTTTPIAQAAKPSNDLYSLLLQLVALMQQNNQSSNTETQTQQAQLQTSQQTQQIVQNIQNELSQQNQTL